MSAASTGPVAAQTPGADVPLRRLWAGLLLAPAAWVAQGLFGWYAGARICTSFSVEVVRLVIAVFSLAMLMVAAAGLGIAFGSWRATAGGGRPAAERVEFMALAGVFVSTSFVIAIVWAGLSAAVLNVCGRMR